MTADSLDLGAIASGAYDVEGSPEMTERMVPNARKEGKRGRSAFAADICEAHGGTLENPCHKFSHLPGNGRGPYAPSIGRKMRSFVTGLIKPVVLFGFVGLALWAGSVFLPNIFSTASLVPGNPAGTNANSNRDGNGNATAGNGDGDRSTNGIAGAGQPQSRATNTQRNSGSGVGSPAPKHSRRTVTKESVTR